MSGDHNTNDRTPKVQFPALRQFFSAYLHQDFRSEYRSAIEAAQAYCDEASPDDIEAVRLDWRKWREQMRHCSFDQIQRSIRKLGAAWQPQGAADLDRLGEAFEQGLSR